MLKALGLGSKKPPKEDLIAKHKDQSWLRQQWQNDLSERKKVTQTLSESYKKHKGDFAANRYEKLKEMIKLAIKQNRDLEQAMKTRPRKPPPDGSVPAPGGAAGPDGARKGGLMARLRQNAEGFALHQDTPQDKEPNYAELSSKELETELEYLRKDTLHIKTEFYAERDKFEKLAKDYETSKQLNPTQRYTELKQMIKNATR